MSTHHDTLILCATSRLAQHLNHHAHPALQNGSVVATTQTACTFSQWLDWLFDEMDLRGLCTLPELQSTVLSALQERTLWEQSIAQCLGDDAHLQFNISALAQTAMEAHMLHVVWGVSLQSQSFDETHAFVQWQQQFSEQCAQHHWIDPPRWQQAVAQNFRLVAQALHLPRQVQIAGFTRLNPLENDLLQTLQQQGITVTERPMGTEAPSPIAQSYPDPDSEILAATLWARDVLQQHPEHRIAIVVPDLTKNHHRLQDTLEDILHQQAFNISLGIPLTQFPLVQCALQLLQIIASPHNVDQAAFGELLRNPYWSDSNTESTLRAHTEAQLRKNLPPTTTLQALEHNIGRLLGSRVTSLATHLGTLRSASTQATHRQSATYWTQQVPNLLRASGWLVGRALSSHEFQTQHTLLECIRVMEQLDALLGPVTLSEFLARLRKVCQDRTFQPETEGTPRLQVLGLLEASGLHFDAIWVMGMQDNTWPPPARPNPLLSAQAQRHANAPNASAAIQLAFAQGIHKLLLTGAPDVVFSWSRTEGTAERNPSPLIPATQPEHHLDIPVSPHWIWAAAQGGGAMLAPPINDTYAPPVADNETIQGGTWLLRAQAICPAWGYYQYRLGAIALEEPTEGLDARQKGSFLHAALERFWNRVQHSHALHALNKQDCDDLVAEVVTEVFEAHNANEKECPLKPRIQQLEHNRLCRLIGQWLQLERSREQPFRVLAHERAVAVNIQGIPLNMKVDRIDQLDDGSLLIIDYKTGSSIDIRNWASERLTEPQLPIYAAITPPTEGPVTGVIFAKVRRRDAGWAGITEHDKVLPKVHGLGSTWGRKLFPESPFPDWSSVLQHWQYAIANIATEIKSGDAGVRYEDTQDLAYCDVLPLLRLAEREAQLKNIV